MEAWISIPIAILSLIVSGATFWLTYLRRGRLAMTQPAVIFFGYDDIPKITAKIFVRTLLYSSSEQGQVVESMYARLHSPAGEQVFSFWGYGETEKLFPGSGLYVGRTGLAANHHFVLSVHEVSYRFPPGNYELEIYAKVVGQRPRRLKSIKLDLTDESAAALAGHEGILFERMPSGEYLGHARGH